MVDIKLFFKALNLVVPSVPTSFGGQDSNRLFWVEALVRELRAPDSNEVKNQQELALFPTESDLW